MAGVGPLRGIVFHDHSNVIVVGEDTLIGPVHNTLSNAIKGSVRLNWVDLLRNS